jgi:hypothetical protein
MTELNPKPWDKPFHIPDGVNVAAAIQAMVKHCLPDQQFLVGHAEKTTDAHYYFGLTASSDPWVDMQELAAFYDFDLRCGDNGVIILGEKPFVAPGEIDELIAQIFGEAATADEPVLCRQCDRVLDDGPDICEDCAWDIHDQLDGWTPDD